MHAPKLPTLFLALISGLSAASSHAAETVTHPFLGVTHTQRTETSPRPLNMHIVHIDLTAPGLRFKLTAPAGSRDTVRRTTLDFLNQEQAQLAVNAHFFLPWPSADSDANVVGLAASEGAVFSPFEPQPIAPLYADQSYAILPWAPALNIDADNRAAIVHRDPRHPDNKHVLEPVTLWNAVSGSAQIVTAGVKTIPAYSGPPDGLTPGRGYSDANSWYAQPRARTAIGLTRDARTLVLFTVDGTAEGQGLTPAEVADLLIRDYRVYNALNLDGGGSTTLALEDPATHARRIVNVPADNPLGRPVATNLAVFAAPIPEPSSLTLPIAAAAILLSAAAIAAAMLYLLRRKRAR